MNPIQRLAILLLVTLGTTGTAAASSLTLTPGQGTFNQAGAKVQQNTVFKVDLNLDATGAPGTVPGLFGGNIVIEFNKNLLSYGGFSFNPSVPALAFFDAPVTTTTGTTQKVTFGFNNAPRVGLVGNFTFTAIGSVGSLASIGLADADNFMGTFISYQPTYQAFYPTFGGTQLGISAVPLPAGLGLLGTALGALGFRRLLTTARRSRRQP